MSYKDKRLSAQERLVNRRPMLGQTLKNSMPAKRYTDVGLGKIQTPYSNDYPHNILGEDCRFRSI